MVKAQESQKRSYNKSVNNSNQNNTGNANNSSNNQKNNSNNSNNNSGNVRSNFPSRYASKSMREKADIKEGTRQKENAPIKNPGRIVTTRQSYSNNFSTTKYSSKIKTEETADDIKEDIMRIEKEIDLEIKEIRSLKL